MFGLLIQVSIIQTTTTTLPIDVNMFDNFSIEFAIEFLCNLHMSTNVIP